MWLAVLADAEILGFQIPNRLTFTVRHDDVDANEIDAAANRRLLGPLRLLPGRRLLGRRCRRLRLLGGRRRLLRCRLLATHRKHAGHEHEASEAKDGRTLMDAAHAHVLWTSRYSGQP